MAKRNKKMKKGMLFGLIALVVIAIGAGFWFFGDKEKLQEIIPGKKPKEEEKKLQIVDLGSSSRSFAVMINNHNQARPYHSGLGDAYIVYEMIVEGSITRYLAIFRDASTEKIGSVRSARHYFLDYALENDAIYVHWGQSPQAQADINSLRVNAINGIAYEGKYFFRDKSLNVSSEHTGFTSMKLVNEGASNLNYRTTSEKRLLLDYSVESVDMASIEGAKAANTVSIDYGSNKTEYVYDAARKVYLRRTGGTPHIDYVTKEQFSAKNIITYKVSTSTIAGDSSGRQDFDNIGRGEGYFISEGYAVPITWEKSSRSAQTVYKYNDGTEIKVNDGNTWIQIQPTSRTLVIE